MIIMCSSNALAKLPNIVALVNDAPITLYEFEARKKFIAVMQNVQNPNDTSIDKQLNKIALESLIDEKVLEANAENIGAQVSDEDIDAAITDIEERNKMPKGGFIEFLKSKNVNIDSARSQLKAQIIQMNVFSRISRTIKISPKDIDSVILSNEAVDVQVLAKIFTSKDKNDKTLRKMYTLQKSIKKCDVKPSLYDKFANVVELDKGLKTIDKQLQTVIKDLEIGQTSSVFETEEGFKLVLLCDRVIKGVTEEENKYITNFLTHKQMSKNTVRFLENLKKKACIQVFM